MLHRMDLTVQMDGAYWTNQSTLGALKSVHIGSTNMNNNQTGSTQRIKAIDPGMAKGKAKELLDAVVTNTAALRTRSK
jgi:hypothetical protein